MAINTNFNTQRGIELNVQIDSLSSAVKGFKWKISQENLGACDVQNQVHTATAYILSSLSEKIYGKTDDILQNLMNKIMDAGEIIETLRDPRKTDPRLFTLVNIKIPKLKYNSLHKTQKIETYSELLKNLAGSDHQVSQTQIARAQMQLMRASLTTDCSKPELPSHAECVSPLVSLQETINALSIDTPESFSKALDGILELDGLTFKTYEGSRIEDKEMTDRIFFHLQSIHKKESPEKVNADDTNHGSSAFLSQKVSTSEERLRAAKRTQTEVSIFALKEFLKGDKSIDSPARGKDLVLGIFEILENLNLDSKDLPKDQKNLAHMLFGKLYHIYLAAWEKDKSMIHPHDRVFNNDFGRNAFIGNAKDKIPNAYKIQALNEISQVVKEAWGL